MHDLLVMQNLLGIITVPLRLQKRSFIQCGLLIAIQWITSLLTVFT